MKTIVLTKGYIALVDDIDFKSLSQYKWHYGISGAVARVNKEQVLMHRHLLCPPRGLEIDHINGNKFDNRRRNMRLCTRAENARNQPIVRKDNKTGHKGVYWHTSVNKWAAKLQLNYKQIHLGVFADKEDAIKAYKKGSKKYYGKFSRE